MIVVFLFLGSLRATIIPAIAVPVSLIGTFAVLLLMGYSANTVSLLALVLAIGIVVDDAIVVVENVERVMEEEPELSPARGDARGDGQITAPIIAITPGAAFGVRADRLHPRHLGPAVPAVRGDDQRCDADLGDQRADACRRRCAPSSCAMRPRRAGRWAGCCGAIDNVRDGYAAIVQRLVRGRRSFRCCWSLIGAAASSAWRASRRPASCRRRIRAHSSSTCNCPTAPRSPAPARRCGRSRQLLKPMPQVQDVFAVIGFSLLDGANESNAGFMVAKLKPFEDRRRRRQLGAGADRATSSPRASRSAPRTSSPSTCRRSSACRPRGGFEYQLEALEGQDPVQLGSVMQGAGRRGQPGPAAQRASSRPLPRPTRRSISTSTATRRRRSASP